MEKQKVALVWFRRDLRLTDNPALSAAADSGLPILPLFIWYNECSRKWPIGVAGQWWRHASLQAFNKQLRNKLVIRIGRPSAVLPAMVKSANVRAVYWNRLYEPESDSRDQQILESLTKQGVEVHTFNGSLLIEPWEIETQKGTPFRVFTPFWKTATKVLDVKRPLPRPKCRWIGASSESLPQPKVSFDAHWVPGELGAHDRLDHFADIILPNYHNTRDLLAIDGTSKLSPHLHFGEISPVQVWYAISQQQSAGVEPFLRQLIWREFSYHLLHHYETFPDEPFREEFSQFPWNEAPQNLKAWQEGLTGYPIVDAGMRQLKETGWMHNRARMIVASFLTKDLLIPWQIGERWFWDRLVDGDLANNAFGWQWASGCGADAAPYFRIFNPTLQGEKFDPEGAYVRRWVPELVDLSAKEIHQPWKVSAPNYPPPIIDHQQARQLALAAWEQLTPTGSQ